MNNREIFFRNIGLTSNFPLDIEIECARGIYMYAPDGKQYIDLVSGVSVSNIGHCHPAVVAAVKEQTEKYMHLMVYGEIIQSPQVRFAELLTQQLPTSLDCVYFVNSGAEATDGAMKLAKRFTRRFEICAFKNAYHGSAQGSMSGLGSECLKRNFRPLIPGTTFLPYDNFDVIQLITEKHAAVIVEPVQGEGGMIVPQKGFLKALRDRCDQTGALLIFDEIQTGFGRTGSLFRFQRENVVPDILCCAKAMGGGMPLGAFISSKNILQSLTDNPPLGHITTFGGHPVSCAAALAQLKVLLEENLISTAEAKGALFRKLLKDHPAVKEIRGVGLMLAVEMESEAAFSKLFGKLTDRGIITDPFLFNTASFRIAPPLIITERQIEECCATIRRCMDAL
ncbi:MAG: aspartate aminotransferase family protein [Bacteroidales bacterium]|jgi:acetylornithine/succinyldiaminopimelate/putrescine aminotransferase|nr:aspartate aminotransferase family protein [Bacteroidales bacterium]